MANTLRYVTTHLSQFAVNTTVVGVFTCATDYCMLERNV